jgi:hypothetical protein
MLTIIIDCELFHSASFFKWHQPQFLPQLSWPLDLLYDVAHVLQLHGVTETSASSWGSRASSPTLSSSSSSPSSSLNNHIYLTQLSALYSVLIGNYCVVVPQRWTCPQLPSQTTWSAPSCWHKESSAGCTPRLDRTARWTRLHLYPLQTGHWFCSRMAQLRQRGNKGMIWHGSW